MFRRLPKSEENLREQALHAKQPVGDRIGSPTKPTALENTFN
jgi:hypothetical protein